MKKAEARTLSKLQPILPILLQFAFAENVPGGSAKIFSTGNKSEGDDAPQDVFDSKRVLSRKKAMVGYDVKLVNQQFDG